MNFDKFKSVRPSVKSTKNVLDKISDKDEKYIEKLAKIQYKKSNSRKIIQIVSTTAAAERIIRRPLTPVRIVTLQCPRIK